MKMFKVLCNSTEKHEVSRHVIYYTCTHPDYYKREELVKHGHSFEPDLDLGIGVAILLLSLLGLVGNLFAFNFFCKIREKHLHLSIFIMICVAEASLCGLFLPVVPSLLRQRLPGIFNSYIFCGIWTNVSNFLEIFSVFLVVVLNVTRSISFLSPINRKIDKVAVMRACVCFGAGLLLVDLGYTWSGKIWFVYRTYEVSCKAGATTMPAPDSWIYYSTLLPSLVVAMVLILFISFFLNSVGLISNKQDGSKEKKEEWEDTVTITWYTGIYLFMNMPRFFAIFVHLTVDLTGWQKNLEIQPVLFWYRSVIGRFLLGSVGTVLSLLLYLVRYKNFKYYIADTISQSVVQPLTNAEFRRSYVKKKCRSAVAPLKRGKLVMEEGIGQLSQMTTRIA